MKAGDIELAGRRVLIVEDESMVSMIIEDALVDFGCVIVGSASRFEDADKKARSLSFDVAILDINLNGRQTLPIAEALAERGVAFVFATGYATSSIPEALRKAPILQKPFRLEELAQALRTALALAA
jgi:DNA-binding NarL/FixJ family response regulator